MKLIGKIFNSKTDKALFGANIFVSDKDGKLLSPTNGAASDPDGNYVLNNVAKNTYVTVSYLGYKKETYPLQITNNQIGPTKRNFGLTPQTNQLPVFSVVEHKDKPLLIKNNKKIVIAIAGIGLVAVIIGTLVYKKL